MQGETDLASFLPFPPQLCSCRRLPELRRTSRTFHPDKGNSNQIRVYSSVSNFFVRYFAKFVRVALIGLAKIRHKRIINLLEFDLATADHPNLNQSDILLPKRQGVIWTRRRKKSDTMTFEIWATLVNTKIVSTSWIGIISSSLVFHLLVKVARHLDIDIRTPRPQRSWYKRNNQTP